MEESIVERVLILIKDYGLTASEFADKIDVQRSSMSHLVSGRNKPSLDFIQKILNNFSDINPTWLIMGSGPMKQLDLFDIKGDVAPSVPLPAKEVITEETRSEAPEQPAVKHTYQAESIRAVAETIPVRVPVEESKPVQTVPPAEVYAAPVTQPAQPVISAAVPVVPVSSPVQTVPVTEQIVPQTLPPAAQNPLSQAAEVHSIAEKSVQNDKKVVKIVFFYSDNTFETFNPQ